MRQTTYKGATITALGHDGFLLELSEPKLAIAFDPYEIAPSDQKANYIFVSHAHFDHCHPDSLRQLMDAQTKIVAPVSCQEALKDFGDAVVWYEGTDKQTLGPLTFWAIPAYNVNKFRTPGEVFHPQSLGGVGFIVEVGGLRFFHAGDTDVTPEMATLKKIDVAFLPISGTYVMTVEEAVQATELIQPKLAIPMHFGKVLGSVADAHRFQTLLTGKIPVAVLTTD